MKISRKIKVYIINGFTANIGSWEVELFTSFDIAKKMFDNYVTEYEANTDSDNDTYATVGDGVGWFSMEEREFDCEFELTGDELFKAYKEQKAVYDEADRLQYRETIKEEIEKRDDLKDILMLCKKSKFDEVLYNSSVMFLEDRQNDCDYDWIVYEQLPLYLQESMNDRQAEASFKATDIEWDVDMDTVYDILDETSDEDIAKLLGTTVGKVEDMMAVEVHEAVRDKFHHCPGAMYDFLNLPESVDVPAEIVSQSFCIDDIIQDMADWLSDTYGYCHEGFVVSATEETAA